MLTWKTWVLELEGDYQIIDCGFKHGHGEFHICVFQLGKVGQLNAKSAKIAEQIKLDDRIEKLAQKEAFVMLKDHKPNFHDHPTCHLINPSKLEIGAISHPRRPRGG